VLFKIALQATKADASANLGSRYRKPLINSRRKTLKRLIFALTALSLAVVATAYYSVPNLFKEPLVNLNRGLSGLSEKKLAIGAHDVHYLDGGSGAPVVLLHGIFSEKDHWVDFARQLTGSYRVIVPDLPGYGESGRLADQAYDYPAQTERLKTMLDALGIGPVHLAGNSMGGTIAALFALQYPDRVASVAFIGAPHGIRSPKQSEMDIQVDAGKIPLIARDAEEFEQMMSLLFVERPFLPYPILHAARSDAVRNAQSNVRLWHEQLKNRHLLDERIADLRVSTLALWGAGDQIFDVSGAQVLRARLKNANVRVLPGVGHLPMTESPKETSRIYAGFLKSIH
jgi:pimeloyl-ACP methyl ester carboxylesterase